MFEPVSAFAERIKKRFRRNHRIAVLPHGLGASTRAETIHLSADASSTFGKSASREEIRVVDVKEWMDGEAIARVDLMKINIEGGEYELLDRLIETRLIERIGNIQVQFHDIASHSRSDMERIQMELSRTHRPIYQYTFVWESWTRR